MESKQLNNLKVLKDLMDDHLNMIFDDIDDGNLYDNSKHDIEISMGGKKISLELNADFHDLFQSFLEKAIKEEEEYISQTNF